MASTLADLVQTMGDYEKGVTSIILDDMAGGAQNLLSKCPIDTVNKMAGTELVYDDEGPSTGIGSRSLYGAFPEGTPQYKTRSWVTGNIGGRAAVDQILRKTGDTNGIDLLNDAMTRKSKQINRNINNGCINGDRATDPNYIDGWKKWLLPANVIQMSDIGAYGTAGCKIGGSGVAVADQKAAIEAIDYLLALVGGLMDPNVYLVGNYQTQRTFNKSIKELGWFGTQTSYFDKTVAEFGGVKWLNPGSKSPVTNFMAAINDTNSVIPNTFSFGTTPTGKTTEVWAVKFGVKDGFHLKQFEGLKVTPIGRLQQAPIDVEEISWYLGTYAANDSCIAKLTGLQAVA